MSLTIEQIIAQTKMDERTLREAQLAEELRATIEWEFVAVRQNVARRQKSLQQIHATVQALDGVPWRWTWPRAILLCSASAISGILSGLLIGTF